MHQRLFTVTNDNVAADRKEGGCLAQLVKAHARVRGQQRACRIREIAAKRDRNRIAVVPIVHDRVVLLLELQRHVLLLRVTSVWRMRGDLRSTKGDDANAAREQRGVQLFVLGQVGIRAPSQVQRLRGAAYTLQQTPNDE